MIRPAHPNDADAIWRILEPIIRAGETYTLARETTRTQALAYWLSPDHECFVFEQQGEVSGTYFLRANQTGGGAHVANCGYATAIQVWGRGMASAMCAHSIDRARSRGFRAMQFNFVVETNQRAVRLWRRHGFDVVGTLPEAFLHPELGYVDALVMHRFL